MKQNRRNFIKTSGLVSLSVPFVSSGNNKNRAAEMKNIFLHHVFFWLKNENSIADRDKLVEGLMKLSAVKTIRDFHIGRPAGTNRDVIETGYAASWFVKFDNAADQASYQTDPIHLKFIEECSHVWSKVIVYDSVDVK